MSDQMYFPILDALNANQVSETLIEALDTWLGTRRQNKYLNPLQFCLDFKVSEEDALHLFALCADKAIGLLSVWLFVECPMCKRILGPYQKLDIPKKMTCDGCELEVKTVDHNITIWFKLLKDPQPIPYLKEYLHRVNLG